METCGKSFKNDKDEEENDEKNTEEMMQAILSGFSIGTPATRAETIKKLKDIGYIKTKGKSLTTTELGRTIVGDISSQGIIGFGIYRKVRKNIS